MGSESSGRRGRGPEAPSARAQTGRRGSSSPAADEGDRAGRSGRRRRAEPARAGRDTAPSLPILDDEPSLAPTRRRFGLPGWGWFLVLAVICGVLLVVKDLGNRDRFRLYCTKRDMQLQRAHRFPWPFGFETMGGPLGPLELPPDAECATQYFDNREDAEAALLGSVLAWVRRALATPESSDLERVERQLDRALQLSRRDAIHAARRREAKRLMADLAYRQGRAGLARVETDLRQALSKLQQARKLGADRYERLDDWVAQLEKVLRAISPSPGEPPSWPSGPASMPSPTSVPAQTPRSPKAGVRPAADGGRAAPSAPPLQPPSHRPADAGASKPADAGKASSGGGTSPPGSGILM